jgi:hypothetical protein
LEAAFARKNSLLTAGGTTAERDALRLAHNALAAHRRAELARARLPAGRPIVEPAAAAGQGNGLPAPPDMHAAKEEAFPLLAFDNWRVNVIVPPLLLGLMWLLNRSPLVFFLRGFQVWMHEFGHATAAWMCGRRATPLPLGWTPVEPDFSSFVYGGLLLMFGVLFVAGWRERKAWPMLAAAALAGLQFYMTWRMPESRQEFWWGAFGGVGGEFYLSAALMAFFFVQLPEKFRWGGCRYVFFLIGATAFLNITGFWDQVNRGLEDIPFGTMINGEEDQGGDMNKLMDAYGWTRSDIRHNFQFLGRCCWAGLGVVYAVFALRLNLLPDKILAYRRPGENAESAEPR